jgi:arabinofuranan 3-O-arabinosyltransferase
MKRLATAWREASWLARALLAVGLIQFAIVAVNSYRGAGIDFYWVHLGTKAFLNGGHPYDVTLFVNPPPACLLLAPFGLGGFTWARTAFLVLDALAIVAAAAICLRTVGLRTLGVAGGIGLLLLAEMPAVKLTLALANVNGLVFLCEAVALIAILKGRWNLAGVALGLSFAIKPIVVLLLLFPLLARRWRSVGIAIGLPVVLSLAAFAVNRNVTGFFDNALPFLLKGNDPRLQPHNASIVGVFEILDLPRAAGELVRYAVAALALSLAWVRWRRPATEGGTALRLLETSGLLLLVTILCFSFSWTYYGIYLLPFVVTIAVAGSLLRNLVSVVGLFLMFTHYDLTIERYANASHRLYQVRPTLAWLLILAGMAIAMWRRGWLSRGQTRAVQVA